YFGSHAVNAYQVLAGNDYLSSVPLETGGGSGTAGVHWSESTFGNELMTGYIGGVPDPLSILTIGSLQDMGYLVNYSAADPYPLPAHLVAGLIYSDWTGTNMPSFAPGPSDTTAASQSLGDIDGSGVVLLTNYMASTFSHTASEGTGDVAIAEPIHHHLLAQPLPSAHL